MSSTSVELPGTLRWAVRLIGLEAVVVAGLVVFLLYENLTAEAADLADALALTGFAALAGAALAGLAVGLARRKARARAPAIVLQLLAVMVAYLLITGGVLWVGVPVVLLGVVVTTLLVAPATSAALH